MPSPNKIKYSTTPTLGTIKANNFLIGINSGVTYGSTSVTGFYQSLTPAASGFTIHQNKATLGPSTFRPNNDTEFINLTKALGGNVTGVTDALVYLKSQSDMVVINRDYEDVYTSGLTVCLDPGYTPSYPRSGTTFYNLANISSPLTFTLNNGISYSTEGSGSLLFDGVDDEVVSNLVYTVSSGMTWDIWIKRTSDGNIFNMIMSHFMPYLAFRGTGSGGSTNQFQIAYRSVTGGTSEQRNLYTTTTYQNNSWYNVTFTLFYDLPNLTSTAKIYVNGVLNTSVSHYSDGIYQASSTQRLRIGNYTSNQYPFPGYIGRFFIYDRVLNDNEVLSNFDAQKSRYITTYLYYRWQITESKISPPNGNCVQASEFRFRQDGVDQSMTGVTVTNPNGNNPVGEEPPKLVDNNLATKGLDLNFVTNGNVTNFIFQFPTARAFNGYRWATANDEEGRDPKSWTVSGSNNGTTWTTLHTVTNFSATSTRNTFQTAQTY